MTVAVYCPTGCGSKRYRAVRRGTLIEDFTIDEETGEVQSGEQMAEAGGVLTLICDGCGHTWKSKRDLDVALFIQGR